MGKYIKPCPFCNGDAVQHVHSDTVDGRLLTSVKCKDYKCCGVSMLGYDDESIKKWNQRVDVYDKLKSNKE